MAIICSKFYWGYYFAPPTINLPKYIDIIDSIIEVRYTKDDEKTEINSVTNEDVIKGALKYSKNDVDYPYYRLFYYIDKYNFKLNNNNNINDKAKEIALKSINIFRKSGIEAKSEEGYDSSRYVYCDMAIGKDKLNNNIVIMSAHGGEKSNDHYPQYNVVYNVDASGNFQLIKKDIYFEDVAGVEGARAHIIAVVFIVLWTIFLAIIFVVLAEAKYLFKNMVKNKFV